MMKNNFKKAAQMQIVKCKEWYFLELSFFIAEVVNTDADKFQSCAIKRDQLCLA